MKSIIKTASLIATALLAFTAPSKAAVMTLDALGDPISILYHSEDQTYTGANTFANFDDLGSLGGTPIWTWDVSVTQTGTTGQIDIIGNTQVSNIFGFRRGFSFALAGGLGFVSAAIVDAADFTGFATPFVTVTADNLTFVADNFGAGANDLHAIISFTTTTTVPVPAALVLLGFGLLGLGLRRRTAV